MATGSLCDVGRLPPPVLSGLCIGREKWLLFNPNGFTQTILFILLKPKP